MRFPLTTIKIVCAVLGAALLISVPLVSVTHGQSAPETDATSAPAQQSSANSAAAPAQLVFWNRRITVFRSYINQLSPADRAARAAQRIAALPDVAPEWRIVANPATVGPYSGAIISVNDQQVFAIVMDDLDTEANETLEAATTRATAQLRTALEARAQQRNVPLLLRAIALSFLATLLLLFALWLLVRATRRVRTRFVDRPHDPARTLALGGFDFQPVVRSLSRLLTTLTLWAAIVVLIYLWLTYVLLRFPYTQPWGQQLGAFLLSIFATLGDGILHSIPGIFTVLVIFLVTRIIVRVVSGVFRQVEKGDLTIPWLHADTARATRYLVILLLWIFAITVAYPYVPGSNTDAFKGVTVLVGVMISLGSAGLVNQIMSGLVVVYSRALKPGELVQVGDDFGVVTDVGMLSTKIVTRKKEEITIPHAVLVGARTVNYSRHAAAGEAQVSTTITIGYDAPWRQVHELLLNAAGRTEGVRKDPAPRVWQRALANFYVEYELVVNLDQPEQRIPILSELHMEIQDAFNEAGVQIMSPAFESQPEQKVIVPKAHWFPNHSGK